jgi:hypothetical protein
MAIRIAELRGYDRELRRYSLIARPAGYLPAKAMPYASDGSRMSEAKVYAPP